LADEGYDGEDFPSGAARPPRPVAFGTGWDTQLGPPSAPADALAPLGDAEDFDGPEIPEYLIAEQRRGGQRGGRGARGGRSAYQSAMDRERFGRGGGGGQRGGRGINRYPDVSSRQALPAPREDRSFGRPQRQPAPQPRSSSEPWSDVPPELEAILRAQVAQKTSQAGVAPADRATVDAGEAAAQEEAIATANGAGTDAAVKTRAPRAGRKPAARSTRGKAAAGDEPEALSAQATEERAAPPKRRSTRSKAAATEATEGVADGEAPAPKATRARTTKAGATRASSRTSPTKESGDPEEAAPAPKRRTRKASTTEAV
jgi:hypothetical protein